MVVDPFGRPLSNLRVSVNEACNLRCSYCHLEGGAMTAGDVTVDEYARLFGVAARLGVTSLKLTGGEPTLHPRLEDIIAAAAARFGDVSMTTNGLLLAERAARYRAAGLGRVNVSLDTLDHARYRHVTGVDALDRVVDGIRAARATGMPVKLNMVVLRDFNTDEVDAMCAFAADEGVHLQLIELHTDRTNAAGIDFQGGFVSLGPIEKRLAESALDVAVAPQHARQRYYLGHGDDRSRLADAVAGPPADDAGGRGMNGGTYVEVVRPQGNADFCGDCQRLRVTGDGKLKPCLMRFDNYVDVLGALRGGADDDELVRSFLAANERRAPYWSESVPVAASGLPRLRVVS